MPLGKARNDDNHACLLTVAYLPSHCLSTASIAMVKMSPVDASESVPPVGLEGKTIVEALTQDDRLKSLRTVRLLSRSAKSFGHH